MDIFDLEIGNESVKPEGLQQQRSPNQHIGNYYSANIVILVNILQYKYYCDMIVWDPLKYKIYFIILIKVKFSYIVNVAHACLITTCIIYQGCIYIFATRIRHPTGLNNFD